MLLSLLTDLRKPGTSPLRYSQHGRILWNVAILYIIVCQKDALKDRLKTSIVLDNFSTNRMTEDR